MSVNRSPPDLGFISWISFKDRQEEAESDSQCITPLSSHWLHINELYI